MTNSTTETVTRVMKSMLKLIRGTDDRRNELGIILDRKQMEIGDKMGRQDREV